MGLVERYPEDELVLRLALLLVNLLGLGCAKALLTLVVFADVLF